jgi:GntR family transcriptional regulator
MFVNEGARAKLLIAERQRFLEKEWPLVIATIERLELNLADLQKPAESSKSSKDSGGEND